jgi:signal peptidase II
MPRSADRRVPFWGVLAVTVLLDRITKMIAESRLVWGDAPIPVIGDFTRWRLVYNTGAAFGLHLGSYSRWAFMLIACVAVVVLYKMWQEADVADRFRQLALAFVAGGAVGNLIDRVLSARGVVDFIDMGIGEGLRWPTYNVADIAVTCGALALAISLWREDARRAPAPTA